MMAEEFIQTNYQYSMWSVCGNILAVVTGLPAFCELGSIGRNAIATACCDPASGLGADNIIFLGSEGILDKGQTDPVPMHVIEPTGEPASMCGNGLGCAAAHLAEVTNTDRYDCCFRILDEVSHDTLCRASVSRRNRNSWDFSADLGRERNGVGQFITQAEDADESESVLYLDGVLDVGAEKTSVYFTVVGEPHIVVVNASCPFGKRV